MADNVDTQLFLNVDRLKELRIEHRDLDDVIETAARTGTALEVNSIPNRLDLDDVHADMVAGAAAARERLPDLPPEGTFKCGARVEYVNEKR